MILNDKLLIKTMEVTPQVFIDPATGEEIISYDHALVIDHSYIDEVQRQHRELEQQNYYEDANGIHSQWADQLPDEAEYEAYEEQHEVEAEDDSDDYYTEEQISSFIDEVYDIAGGQEGYAEMIAHARETWNDQDIEQFNAVMDSENLQLMSAAIQFLIEDWNEMVEEQQELNYWSRG